MVIAATTQIGATGVTEATGPTGAIGATDRTISASRTANIDRTEWGLSTFAPMIGTDIAIRIEVEALQQ